MLIDSMLCSYADHLTKFILFTHCIMLIHSMLCSYADHLTKFILKHRYCHFYQFTWYCVPVA